MKEKSTGDLRETLMNQGDLDTYLKENEGSFLDLGITEFLSQLYAEASISKAELARRAGISEVYLHQVFSGRRRPSRDRLLCICVGLGIGLPEVQRLLKQAGYAELYPKFRRDAILIYGIVHHAPLDEINDKLYTENERTLF